MKKRIVALFLSLSFCVPLFPAALAEGEKAKTAFSDVPAGSWYESGIRLCAEKGIMIGMGDGTFAPDKTLTAAECLTLALRLYDLCHGGAGVIEKAPEDWNRITVTAADGTTVTGKPEEPFQYQGRGAKGLYTEGIWYAVQPGQEAAAQALDGTAATVTIHGKDYPATLSYSTRSYVDGTSENILFAAYTGDNSSIYHAFAVTTNHYWWVDSAAMVQKLGLYDWTNDESNGFRDLYVTAASGAEATARRAQFADSLATATGTLPVLQENVTIPDLGIPEQGVAPAYENILALYRAGILNGKDKTGNFDYYGQLTRAEAATMVARVLDPALRIGANSTPTQPPADNMTTSEAEVEIRQYDSYAAAVADLRSGTGHSNEKIYETPDCDIYVFDRGGFLNAPKGMMVAVYKKGSALGDGAALTLPFARAEVWMVCTPADTLDLSADKKSFTYTYTFEEELLFENVPVRGKGTFTYAFDIPSGKVTLTAPKPSTVSYADALAKVTEDKGFTVEKTLESPYCTIVLGYYTLTGGIKDYAMCYVYKTADTNTSGTPEGAIRWETFSYTNSYVDDPATGHVSFCTDRAPDTLVLSKDGSTLFYSYDLGSGPLTEITGGGIVTSVKDLTQGCITSYTPEETVEVLSRGCTLEKRVDGASAVALLVYDEPYGVRDYVLYVIDRETGVVSTALLPSTTLVENILPNGAVYYPTHVSPASLSYQAEDNTFVYTYPFDQALVRDGVRYHEAGVYTYRTHPVTGVTTAEFQPK